MFLAEDLSKKAPLGRLAPKVDTILVWLALSKAARVEGTGAEGLKHNIRSRK